MSLHKNTVKLSVGNTTKSKFKMAHQIHSTNPTDANHKKKKQLLLLPQKKIVRKSLQAKTFHFDSSISN